MLLAAGFVFAACSEDEEVTPAPMPTGAQVFFGPEVSGTIELPTTASQYVIPVYRANTSGAITVPINATLEEGTILSVPESVSFADGEESTELVITYNPEDIEYGKYENVKLAIADNYSTPYGYSVVNLKMGATEWVSMGMGYYRDDLFTSWYAIDNQVYALEIQKNVVVEGMYRVVNPYGAAYPYNDPGDWDDSQDYYLVIDATDPDYVWIPTFHTGCDWGKGEMWFLSFVQYYINGGNALDVIKAVKPELFGTFKDGIITMPANAMLAARGDDGYWYSNPNGMFAVALPGNRFADYSMEYEYLGRFIGTDQQYYIEGIATLGDDIASAKAALVTAETYEETLAAIIAGEAGIDIANGEAFRLPFDESGIYYVLIVAFNEAGEYVGDFTSKVNAVIEGGTTTVTWEAQFVGDYYYDLFSSEEEPAIDTDLTLSVDADNDAHYQIAPWGNGQTLEFILNEDGTITVPAEQPSGVSGTKGELYVADVQTFTGGSADYADKVSYYEGGKFTLWMVYYNDQEAWLAQDTFTLTGNASVKASHVAIKRAADIKKITNVRLQKRNLKKAFAM